MACLDALARKRQSNLFEFLDYRVRYLQLAGMTLNLFAKCKVITLMEKPRQNFAKRRKLLAIFEFFAQPVES